MIVLLQSAFAILVSVGRAASKTDTLLAGAPQARSMLGASLSFPGVTWATSTLAEGTTCWTDRSDYHYYWVNTSGIPSGIPFWMGPHKEYASGSFTISASQSGTLYFWSEDAEANGRDGGFQSTYSDYALGSMTWNGDGNGNAIRTYSMSVTGGTTVSIHKATTEFVGGFAWESGSTATKTSTSTEASTTTLHSTTETSATRHSTTATSSPTSATESLSTWESTTFSSTTDSSASGSSSTTSSPHSFTLASWSSTTETSTTTLTSTTQTSTTTITSANFTTANDTSAFLHSTTATSSPTSTTDSASTWRSTTFSSTADSSVSGSSSSTTSSPHSFTLTSLSSTTETSTTTLTSTTQTSTTAIISTNFTTEYSWAAIVGDCTLDGDCMQSPNYPQKYDANQACTLHIDLRTAVPIAVESFTTESGYDKLTVNGVVYSGFSGPSGITPSASISWTSDHSLHQTGWRLCMPGASSEWFPPTPVPLALRPPPP
ncbi:unnamed protein product, partial [Prorocentrum cordatum]